MFNPFPGLRPFEPNEDHLFFGREKEIDDLLRRLRLNRFVAVVGTSGSGKSSLVRSGLIPALYGGFLAKAGSTWRVGILRPGEDPISHLADAINAADVLGTEGELAGTERVLLEATLRRGTLGLVDAVRQARIPPTDNLLVVVDQFEELFRFRESRQIEHSRDEAVAFVKLLLEATQQDALPIYVVLTMRSDFIGDCMNYPGLPEAVNEGQYLVPRMTRDELRSAITGPIAVGGGEIAPRLVLRLLNDIGDDPYQLPILQHALMRTWEHWESDRRSGEPIDVSDYEAVGTVKEALSRHAEEAYAECAPEPGQQISERIFKALTDTFSDPRGTRRPTTIGKLAAICQASEADVSRIVDIFRSRGRSFLMPPPSVPLGSDTIVDLSHESLMRCWTRLITWAEEERGSAAIYTRLSQAASWFEEGAAGLWRNPELELGLRWRRQNQPTDAWARRYAPSFDRAMRFLDQSQQTRDHEEAERERERRRKLRQAQWAAVVFGTLFLIAVTLAAVARIESGRAASNLRLAKDSVDAALSSADLDPQRAGADVPQVQELRRGLLEKAKRFYVDFLKQEPGNEDLRHEMALAHYRLGHINRLLESPDEAVKEFREAIAQFESLAKQYPARAEYPQALANAYNWLGETVRPSTDLFAETQKAYDSALAVQRNLVRRSPTEVRYRQELARTLYNRGILRYEQLLRDDPDLRAPESQVRFDLSGADFREAIQLLEPLADQANAEASQDLARARNDLSGLLILLPAGDKRREDAGSLYQEAVRIGEELTKKDPANRAYKFELAKFRDNLADLLREQGHIEAAIENNQRALDLIDELAAPAPSLGIEQADAHNLRGRILAPERSAEAEEEYQQSLAILERLARTKDFRRWRELHLRFGELLLNMAALCERRQDDERARRLLASAAGSYLGLARHSLLSGSVADTELAVNNLAQVLPALSVADRGSLGSRFEDLQRGLRERMTRHQ